MRLEPQHSIRSRRVRPTWIFFRRRINLNIQSRDLKNWKCKLSAKNKEIKCAREEKVHYRKKTNWIFIKGRATTQCKKNSRKIKITFVLALCCESGGKINWKFIALSPINSLRNLDNLWCSSSSTCLMFVVQYKNSALASSQPHQQAQAGEVVGKVNGL